MYGKKPKGCVLLAIGVLSMSSKSGEKRACVLLAIGEQKREIQNAQVNFIKVQRQKKKVICRSASSSEACA